MKQIFKVIKRHKQLLPLLLLTAYCIDAAVAAIRGTVEMDGRTYDFELMQDHYLAFEAVAINFLIYFFVRKYYKYSLAITIVLGLFNLLLFPALRIEFYFTKVAFIRFQPSAFWAGLLANILNFNRINKYIIVNLSTKTPEEAERYEKELFIEQTEKFKERYQYYSTADLTEIVTTNKLVPAAVEAAQQLLNERQGEDANRTNMEIST